MITCRRLATGTNWQSISVLRFKFCSSAVVGLPTSLKTIVSHMSRLGFSGRSSPLRGGRLSGCYVQRRHEKTDPHGATHLKAHTQSQPGSAASEVLLERR